ncbi:hypothetical protein ACUOA5_12055 [Escherichia coli]
MAKGFLRFPTAKQFPGEALQFAVRG